MVLLVFLGGCIVVVAVDSGCVVARHRGVLEFVTTRFCMVIMSNIKSTTWRVTGIQL